MKALPKNYDHKEAEPRWQERWEETRVYAWDASQPRENTFVIDTPPPTVSGVLHMGHIFSYTQADFVARFMRMSGKTVFYPMGFDDNGLPTERLVEKEKKVKGSAMPREQFVALCREVVKGAEDEFRRLFKSTALSVDWSQEYQTISDEVRKLSQMSFLDLLQKGEAYRDFRPTYWDWVDQTAIAQAEIENKELPGTMNEILFTLEDGTPLHIATTRPELLGACVAVMYHPDDPIAAKYKGKTAITPVFGVKVPMIADEAVEREKGTGLVMCCTFGDDTDKEWQRKHELPRRTIMEPDGKVRVMPGSSYIGEINKAHVGKPHILFVAGEDGTYSKSALDAENCIDFAKTAEMFTAICGLKPKQANAKMIELLQAEGKLLKQDNITHTVKVAERSQTPIEIIPTYQWFVKITDKKDALKAKGDECKWYPEFMHLRLDQWIDGLKEDWCISRQRFFGVPFPVWYGNKVLLGDEQHIHPFTRHGDEEIFYASPEQLPVDPLDQSILPVGFIKIEPKNILSSEVELEPNKTRVEAIYAQRISDGQIYILYPDKDVMDTWATSSVSPQISAHGISEQQCEDKERFSRLFPADLRPQAHEIIRTWAFYTIVKAHLHMDTIPWKNLMISGWCLDSDKKKISKSKGNNIVTPVDLIIDKGADVVRYWASTSRLGADTAFSEDLLKIGKKLVTKLWNASAFVAPHLLHLDERLKNAPASDYDIVYEALDRWILGRLHDTVVKATREFERFEYCDARVAVEEFFWKDFCDNYLELVKGRAYGEIGDTAAQLSAHLTLSHCLNAVLRLFAPFLPHITEELYSHLFGETESIHACGNWPATDEYLSDDYFKKGTEDLLDQAAAVSGELCVEILNKVRKKKSENNVSIKFPVRLLRMDAAKKPIIEPVLADLKSAGNIAEVDFDETLQDSEIILSEQQPA